MENELLSIQQALYPGKVAGRAVPLADSPRLDLDLGEALAFAWRGAAEEALNLLADALHDKSGGLIVRPEGWAAKAAGELSCPLSESGWAAVDRHRTATVGVPA